MPYVNFRWLGGMLTNFRTMHERIKRMRELEDMVATGSIEALPKKEALKLRRELEKLVRNLGGLRNLNRAPEAVFILDTKKEEIAVREAKKLGIPVVAVLDTNSDPDDADYGIPGNDDAIRSGALLTRIVADAVIEGRSMRPPDPNAQPAAESAAAPEDVLPGAAAEPKAEWELQLEAEMAAEEKGGETRTLDSTTPTPDPAAGDPGTSTTPDPKPEPVKDEPGDSSHPSPKPEDS